MLRIILLLAAGLVLSGLTTPGYSLQVNAQSTPAPDPATENQTYELPGEQVFPEGIAYDPAANAFYVGSTSDGTIYRGDLENGAVTVFAEGGADGRTAVTGIKVDSEGRLYAAGRFTGQLFVYDTASGDLLGQFENGLGEDQTLVNDIAIAPDGSAYVTDSFNPVLYRVAPVAAGGSTHASTEPQGQAQAQELEAFLDFADTVFEYGDGFNANGIVATPDGTYLLIVSFDSGRLFRVEVATQAVTEVDLGGEVLTGGDGMALDGQTLYVVRDDEGEITPVDMAGDFASGSTGEGITDPAFDYPTTMALVGDGTALVVNSQLDMAGGGGQPTLPFTIARITLPTS